MLPLIIAHRGASAAAPENTLAAFQSAIDCGADGVEFDVRIASDGVPVVIHDATLERTTGRRDPVALLSSTKLSRIDNGSWFNHKKPKLAEPGFANQGVPSLADVLKLLSGFDGRIYVELKSEDHDLRPLCKAVAVAISRSPLLPLVIVKSFRLSAIPIMRTYCPAVRTGALFAPQIKTLLSRKKHILTVAREMGAEELSLHHSLVSPRFALECKKAGVPITVWTVDDPKYLLQAAKLGVTSLITNDPQKMLRKRAQLFSATAK